MTPTPPAPSTSSVIAPVLVSRPVVSREKLGEIKLAARLELARRYAKEGDILNWGKMVFPEKFRLPFCQELHQYFVDIRGLPLTNTEAPRNHAKSTIKDFLIPIFQGLEEPRAFLHYLNVQATGLKAFAINLAIKAEIEDNQLITELYGNQVGLDKWTDGQFVLRNGVVFTAVGAGQSIRGLNYRSTRPDYIIVDDLYDEEDINNPESTVKKNAWFWGSLYPARAKSRRCCVHVQGTAINNEDLLEELKKKPRWESKSFSAIKGMGTDAESVLWPELNTLESLKADLKDMPSVIFYREMQNERRDETSSIVKRSWLYPTDGSADWEFDPASLKFDAHHQLLEVLLGVDPSIGAKAMSDATGMALVLKAGWDDGRSHVYYVIDLWEERISLDERVLLIQKIKDEALRSRGLTITRARLEGIAGFKDFVAEVIRRTDVPVEEIDSVKDKVTTLINKSHFFENKRVKISRDIAPEKRDALVYQLTTNFPKHDDVRDGLLLCLEDTSSNWSWVG